MTGPVWRTGADGTRALWAGRRLIASVEQLRPAFLPGGGPAAGWWARVKSTGGGAVFRDRAEAEAWAEAEAAGRPETREAARRPHA